MTVHPESFTAEVQTPRQLMRAAMIRPRQPQSLQVKHVARHSAKPDEVLVRVLEVGIDGTDLELIDGRYGDPPAGCDELIIGHEALGRVEEVGEQVTGIQAGELVVATVRRPCAERCLNCRNDQPDFCTTGQYRERGISGLHGFLADCYVERPESLVVIPPALRASAVLTEPLSVVEKGVDQALRAQERLAWSPTRALVLGAGPVGLLATLVLRLMELDVTVADRVPCEHPKSRWAATLGATYVNSQAQPLAASGGDGFDLILEATGVSRLAFEAMCLLRPNGALVLLSVTGGQTSLTVPGDCINLQLVLRNNLILGSVNAQRRHFELAVEHLKTAERRWPHQVARLITHRCALDAIHEVLYRPPEHIKTVVEVG